MKKIAWYHGYRWRFVLSYKGWYIRLPFIKPPRKWSGVFIYATKLRWLGRLPVLHDADFCGQPMFKKDWILPIIYRRKK